MYEPFYLLHERFDPGAKNWIGWQVHPGLVRSIERWCSQIEPLEPLASSLITNRANVQAHFDRWCLKVRSLHGLARSSIIDLLAQHWLELLQQSPADPTLRLHWIALFMQRCATVGWQVWQLLPDRLRSIDLFEEIVSYAYSKIVNPNGVHLVLANFKPGTSQFVSGLNHLKAFIDRRIRYSIFPLLRETSGDPNFGRTNLGVAARYSRGEVNKALLCLHPADRVSDLLVLWQSFMLYRSQTGIPVNRLVAADFERIGQYYRQLSQQPIEQTGAEIQHQIELIGGAIRSYEIRPSVSLDAPISTGGVGTVAISWGETNLRSEGDLLQSLATQDILQIVRMELTKLLDEPTAKSPGRASCQQLFLLYYGLGLKQQQIGNIIHHNFGSTNNAGTVALHLRQGRKYLFQRIHTALKNAPPPLTDLEIDAAMSLLLETYFDRMLPQYLTKLALPVDPQSANGIVIAAMAQQLALELPADLVTTSIDRLLARLGIGTDIKP
jgi:hypothetical protein